MKKTLIIIITVMIPFIIYPKNSFREGNKFYLDGQYDKALEQYSDFVKKNPDRFEGYYNEGNSLFRQEKYKEALDKYNKALELKPEDEDTKFNIEVTKDKIKEQSKKQDQNQDKQDKDKKGEGQNKEGQQGQNKSRDLNSRSQKEQSKNGKGKGKKAQAGNQKKETGNKKPDPGMSGDEVQALLNMMQKQEKQYQKYFGKQNRRQKTDRDFPDFFNMSPDEVMRYMQRKMMDPFGEERQKQGDENRKNW